MHIESGSPGCRKTAQSVSSTHARVPQHHLGLSSTKSSQPSRQIHNRCLEVLSSAKKGTPIPILHAELNTRTLHQEKERNFLHEITKRSCLPETHILAKSHKYWSDHRLALCNNLEQKYFYWRASLAYQNVLSNNSEALHCKGKPVSIQPVWSSDPEPNEAEAVAESQIEQELGVLSEKRARTELERREAPAAISL